MDDAAHILLVGNDGRLLNERAQLLSHFWTVAAVSTFDEVDPYLGLADLLILCHTISDDQRADWIARSRAASPTRPILSLEFAEPPASTPSSGADARVDHASGPAALVSTVYELLMERGLGSKHWVGGGNTLLAADGTPVASR